MTLEEMRDLLATIASYDGRAVDRRVIEDWHAVVGSIPYEIALLATRSWYAYNSGYMKPNDLATSAASVAGLDQPDSVTDRRLNSQPLAHEVVNQTAAPMLSLERKKEHRGFE